MKMPDVYTQPQTEASPASWNGHSFHRVLDIAHLTTAAFRLRLERCGLQFRPGQCVNMGVPGMGVNREYSIYSGEGDGFLEFLVREVQGGVVSTALKKRQPGDSVEIHGAYGNFCLRQPVEGRRYLWVATGTGIAPFHSFVRSYPGIDYQILHGVRQAEECYDRAAYDPQRYVPCLSQGTGAGFGGRVTDYVRRHPVKPDTVCYLCGNRGMINEAYGLLRAQGVSGDQIFTEVFF